MRLTLSKDICLKAINKLYRQDAWLNELFQSAGISMDDISDELERNFNNDYFDKADEKAIIRYEYELGITPNSSQSLEDRRVAVRAKWVGSGKATLQLLQTVADSWKYGLIELEFIGGRIHVKSVSPVGVPEDLDSLKKALENVKPAHLAMYYTFLWLPWGEAKSFGTWGAHKNNGTWLDVKRLKEG